jgi:threonine synthase
VILIPFDLEQSKVIGTSIYGARVLGVQGTYDDVNRLCSEIAGKYGWGFVNVNLRPFYAEGSKSFGYEVAEQLGWKTPAHIVVPMAGGSLVTKIGKAFGELEKLGLLAAGGRKTRIHGAQAAGCAPIVDMVLENRDQVRPVKKPTSIAKSLAIGNPADGFYARQTITGSGGFAGKPNDDEIVAAMRMLAETEGIFAETAGGVTLGATQAHRAGKDRTRRWSGRRLRHRQWYEDLGSPRRRAARTGVDRAAPGRLRPRSGEIREQRSGAIDDKPEGEQRIWRRFGFPPPFASSRKEKKRSPPAGARSAR